MTQQKKMWELQHTTICKVVGMALDLEDLKKISRKFGLRSHDSPHQEEFILHSAVVRLCGEENRISRHVQKLIEHRFSRYARRLVHHAPQDITEFVLKGAAEFQVPLWAIVWHLATRHLVNGEQLQTTLFGFIHVLEHRLVKDFWEQASTEQDKREIEQREEVTGLRRELIKLRSAHNRLERANEGLRNRLVQTGSSFKPTSPSPMNEGLRCSSFQERKIERLRLLLAEAREKNRELEEECSQSKKQMEALTRELLAHETANCTSGDESSRETCPCPSRHSLNGKRIAMVGGIDSLEAHYRELVEQSGGEFCRHDGRCCRGERKLEECIRNADLVVCPISVNSHFGAGGVKRVCKRHGINCCFPDSAGVGALRTILLTHFVSEQMVCGDSAQSWQQ